MKKILKRTYRRVGRDTFIRGMRNGWRIVILGLLALILICILVCAWKVPTATSCLQVYEQVETERIIWQTNPENRRQKVPVIQKVVYYVPNGCLTAVCPAGMALQMDKGEIIASYRDAKDKAAQIGILAERKKRIR